MYNRLFLALFIRRILVAWNAIKTIDNEIINLIMLHYLLFELLQRDRNSRYRTGLRHMGCSAMDVMAVMPSMKQFRKIMRKKNKNNIQTVKACAIYEKVYACMESTNSYKMFA